MTPDVRPEAFSLQRSAVLLGVSVSTLRRWIKSNELRAFRAGPKLLRIPLDELKRLRKKREH